LSNESLDALNLAVNFVESKLNVKVKPIYLDDFKDIYSVIFIVLLLFALKNVKILDVGCNDEKW
jgi:2-polyprenyl-3-methyl-5-hydroxy-6-metoxy-1,4-benzoquinol methylase